MDAIVFVYLFSSWPRLLAAVSLTVWGWQFTSVYLDSQPVVVWIYMNHESFSHSIQEMLGASCYGYATSRLRETPCEINLTDETYSLCPSSSLSPTLYKLARSLVHPCSSS